MHIFVLTLAIKSDKVSNMRTEPEENVLFLSSAEQLFRGEACTWSSQIF